MSLPTSTYNFILNFSPSITTFTLYLDMQYANRNKMVPFSKTLKKLLFILLGSQFKQECSIKYLLL